LLKRDDSSRSLAIGGALGFFVGMAVLGATRFLFLGAVPGLHYDEAWAALFAHRIATEPHFWPLTAMSPYTSPWSHYWAALFFKIFGTSLLIYRASAVALVLAGVAYLSAALRRFGKARAAVILPWLLAFAPALEINERFAIEIDSFLVFCLGLLAYGVALLSSSTPGTPATPADTGKARRVGSLFGTSYLIKAALLGVTSHILFIGTILSLAGAALLSRKGERWTRWELGAGLVITLGVTAFFGRVFWAIPEKDKALSLIVVTLSAAAVCAIPAPRRGFALSRFRSVVRWGILLLGLPGWLFMLFFWEASWNARFHTGELHAPFLIGLTLVAPAVAIVMGVRGKALGAIPRGFLDFWALTVLFSAALAVKPTPRYFEIPLLLAAVFFALLLAELSRPRRLGILALWIACGGVVMAENYFVPLLTTATPDISYRFLFFHENTSDTLDKQRLVTELAASGCAPEQVTTTDSRLGTELEFLALGDWKTAPVPCRWGGRVRVGKLSERPPTGAITEAGPFWIAAAIETH
jgi:hypothetical protein